MTGPVTVTQADREAADSFLRSADTLTLDRYEQSLAQAFMRHRLAAEERGARMALEAAAKVAADAHGCWTDAGSPLGLATAIRQIDPAQIVKGQSDAE